MASGEDLKRIINLECDGSITDAAKKLGVTRATLYSYLNRKELDIKTIQLVNSKFDNKLQEDLSQTVDFQAKYIAQLEKSIAEKDILLAEKDNRIKEMGTRIDSLLNINTDLKSKVQAHLETVLNNQLAQTSLTESLATMISLYVSNYDEQKAHEWRLDLHKEVFQRMKVLKKRGNTLVVDSDDITSFEA